MPSPTPRSSAKAARLVIARAKLSRSIAHTSVSSSQGLALDIPAGYGSRGSQEAEDRMEVFDRLWLNGSIQPLQLAKRDFGKLERDFSPVLDRRSKTLPLIRFQNLLPQPDRYRSHFDKLIVPDKLNRLFQIQNPRRHQPDAFVRSRRPHVGELLFLHDVDIQIGVASVFPDDHAFVDLGAGRHENLTSLL